MAHVTKAFSLSSSDGTLLSANEAAVPETSQDGSQQVGKCLRRSERTMELTATQTHKEHSATKCIAK